MLLRGLLAALALLFAIGGLFPLANVITNGRAVPWWGLALQDWAVRGGIVIAVALLAAILLKDRVDRAIAQLEATLLRPSPRAFAGAVAAFAAGVAAALSWYCFNGRPFTSDEMAQAWHARILLDGRLYAIPETHAEFFNTAPVWDWGGRWFSQYPIGGPAFLALGLLVGAAWLVNPVLLGACAWQWYGFSRRAFGEMAARVTTLLFATSPMVLIMAASQMNHVAALAAALVALHALSRWDAEDPARAPYGDAIVVGVAIGVLATVRPLDAALVALSAGIFQLWRAGRDRRRWMSLGVQIVAGLIPVALLLWANARTTGHPLLFAYDALNGPEHRLGFHVDPNGQLHTPTRGLAFVSGYLIRLSRYLFEWPLPAMLFVVAGLLAVKRPTRWDALLAGLMTAFLAAYGAYWFDGFFSGPRFLFTALPAFVYFAYRSLALLSALRHDVPRRAALLVVPLCIATSWLTTDIDSSARSRVALYRGQRTKLKTDIQGQVERARLNNALVFVNEGWRGRLLARSRALGASQFRAEALVNSVDACALGEALDAASRLASLAPAQRLELVEQRARSYGAARIVPNLPADQAVAIVPGSRPTPKCLAELQQDSAGTMPYPPFLPLHELDDDGRVSGRVVFARDLGAANEQLRPRFGNRTWYYYRPAKNLADTTSPFVPYVRR